jgi:hypothetical protein
MKKDYFLIILFLCTHPAILGQKINFPSDTIFNSVRITTTNWNEIKAPRLILDTQKNSILLIDKYDEESTYQLGQIYSIEEQHGNRSWLFGVTGAVAGFFISYAIAFLNDDPDDYTDGLSSGAISAIIIGGTGICFSIGFLAGKSSKKYRKIYIDGAFLTY